MHNNTNNNEYTPDKIYYESLSFDDILIEPRLSNVESRKNIKLQNNLTKTITLHTPLISSPMDTITEDKMAIHMAIHGGIGIIHRYNSIEEQVKMVQNVKRYISFIIHNPYTINQNVTLQELQKKIHECNVYSHLVIDNNNKLVGIITKRDIEHFMIKNINVNNYNSTTVNEIMTIFEDMIVEYDDKITRNEAIDIMIEAGIEKLPIVTLNNEIIGLITFRNLYEHEKNNKYYSLDKNGKLLVGASIGIVGDYMDRAKALIEAGCDILCIDVANGYNENVKNCIVNIKSAYPDIQIMAGNVCSADGFEYLCNAGADCIRVGIGNGSMCTTRMVTGCGKGQFSSVKECRKIAKKYNVGLISDGGNCGKDGNMAKALIAGADAIMLGRTLAATDETPGKIIQLGHNYRRVKYFRGMASNLAMLSKSEKIPNANSDMSLYHSEGINTEIEIKGPVRDILLRIISSIKSAFSYIGCHTFKELRNIEDDIVFIRQTYIGAINETATRIK
jgi:IMP dehydrogenase